MIEFNRFKLGNGLTVLHHFDAATPMVVVNTLYDVGARDESEEKTGFAHLFEHLMFGGSVNIPDFDAPLQHAGGESNAFTSNDITNYYDILPLQNLETALWLESDRMISLAFTPKSLEVQRNVVIEEFKQRYLNQPYGDVWLELRPLAYKEHSYKWATIGKKIEHIEEATMDDVKAFFRKHYHPANAILCIAGNIPLEETKRLVEKWYGDIPASLKPQRILPKEPAQNEFRELTIERKVPNDAFYYSFKMPERRSFEYYVTDIISDALGREKSSRLYSILKKELKLVTSVNAYITGSLDEGLLIIDGKLSDGVSFGQLDGALWKVLEGLKTELMSEEETSKLLNKIRTVKEFQEQGLLNRAMNLCLYELLGDANGVNEENTLYQSITAEQIKTVSNQILRKENCSLLRVKSIKE
ncbi:pitrilysin family protein [Fluviicola sp.]|jgi:predicted Zn-dependent peptidase|uniref:M16 family metallopeptidase n=1 Tax=Fluviicola sp. TaxID=1917219 RepID=UPI0028313887|nr:pitrilysin family protein [Fluviicola sp.]MDR0802986.1 insulinase family protein [Fluviicola sp.]